MSTRRRPRAAQCPGTTPRNDPLVGANSAHAVASHGGFDCCAVKQRAYLIRIGLDAAAAGTALTGGPGGLDHPGVSVRSIQGTGVDAGQKMLSGAIQHLRPGRWPSRWRHRTQQLPQGA